MCKLIVLSGEQRATLEFEPGALLADVLETGGFSIQRPCGGRGQCGKCAVELTGQASQPNQAERRAGARLACQAVLLGDAQVRLPGARDMRQIEISGSEPELFSNPLPGNYGAAVDIGTTTLALKLYDLKNGQMLGQAAGINPQTAVAADVMGRIGKAVKDGPEPLKGQVLGGINALLSAACAQANLPDEKVDALLTTGNTTMLYLLTGRNPETLSHAPFQADCLFDLWEDVLSRRAYLPPCMNAFVGADITCAALACGMCASRETSVLCDIGTNGEIALWKDGRLYVTSTAAGPAFEGAGISCGVGSVLGAIDKVWAEDGKIRAHTIGGARAVGICGSGLIDAIAALLKLEQIDETGAIEEDALEIRDGVALLGRDVRAVQLAKAAIAAGLETLLETAHVALDEVSTLYIAGGFGSHLNVQSAADIGLIPRALAPRVKVAGNAALSGAARMLLNQAEIERARAIARASMHVNLGGNGRFNENYMEQMMFPEGGA